MPFRSRTDFQIPLSHSIQITVDTYGHLIPGANRKEVNALDDPEWGNGSTSTHLAVLEAE